MRIYKLLPDQVPAFWDAIKYAVYQSKTIEDRYLSSYLSSLLYGLLSGKSNCIVRLDDNKELVALQINRITYNDILDRKTMIVDGLYAFKKSSIDEWREHVKAIVDYAKDSGCNFIMAWTLNDKMAELVINTDTGFREGNRVFVLDI